VTDRLLKAYEYQTDWVNRLILGDSLVVMNSLLQYEGLGGQVQMIYMDPPAGVRRWVAEGPACVARAPAIRRQRMGRGRPRPSLQSPAGSTLCKRSRNWK
jgi:hypothetical protein